MFIVVFQNHSFFINKYFRNTISMSNIWDPGQARLNWTQTVYKGYQQVTLFGKELMLCALGESSFWFDTKNLGRSIVQFIISK